MLQSLNHHHDPSLVSFQYVLVSFVLGSPGLDRELQMWPYQSRGEDEDHLPWPAGDALPNAALEAVGFLCCKDILLAYAQLVVHQDPRGRSCKAAFQLFGAHWYVRLFFPSCTALQFSLLNFMKLLFACYKSL